MSETGREDRTVEAREHNARLPWRVGRKVGRTIYVMNLYQKGPSDDDVLIGMMDTAGLALALVEDHNAALDAARQVPGEALLHGDDEEALTQVEEITGDRTRAEIVVNRLACLWNRSRSLSPAVPGGEADEGCSPSPVRSEPNIQTGPSPSRSLDEAGEEGRPFVVVHCCDCDLPAMTQMHGCDAWRTHDHLEVSGMLVADHERALAEERAEKERLRAVAERRVNHINQGRCPDEVEGFDVRDPECPACAVLGEGQDRG